MLFNPVETNCDWICFEFEFVSLTLLICIGLIYEIHSLEYQQMLGSAHAVAEHCCSHWLLLVFEIPQAVHRGGSQLGLPSCPWEPCLPCTSGQCSKQAAEPPPSLDKWKGRLVVLLVGFYFIKVILKAREDFNYFLFKEKQSLKDNLHSGIIDT